MRKIVDVSGYGHSGKSAISEFIADHKGVFAFPTSVEFELFRAPGGLFDLLNSLHTNFGLIRSNEDIERFNRLIYRIGSCQNWRKPSSFLVSSGHEYDRLFKGRFIELSEGLIEKLRYFSYSTSWPYKKFTMSKMDLLNFKIRRKLKMISDEQLVSIVDRALIPDYISDYIHSLFSLVADNFDTHVLINNGFEPFLASAGTNLIKNSCSIIVHRDPRDIYASLLCAESDKFVPDFESYSGVDNLKKSIVAAGDIEIFVERYRLLHANSSSDTDNSVLRIRYEDFVLKHEQTSNIILKHIGFEDVPERKTRKFNKEESSKNIGLWKNFKDLEEIRIISDRLQEFCY